MTTVTGSKQPLSFLQTCSGIFSNKCPSCLSGSVFRGFYAMHTRCPECGTLYEKESGFFLGAMIASYFLGAFSLVPTLVAGVFVWQLERGTLIALIIGQTAVLNPILFYFSRMVWLYIAQRATTGLLEK